MIGSVLLLALLAVAPVGVLVASARLYRWAIGRRADPPGAPPLGAPRRPLQQVAADLRRLCRQVDLVPASASQTRGRALLAAYDAVLAEAARLLDVPEALGSTPEGWDRHAERLRVEAGLAGAGLRVRD